ncbi:MAG: hypothetical protein ACYDBH_24495 [Acidobacteriaceae bacterium]
MDPVKTFLARTTLANEVITLLSDQARARNLLPQSVALWFPCDLARPKRPELLDNVASAEYRKRIEMLYGILVALGVHVVLCSIDTNQMERELQARGLSNTSEHRASIAGELADDNDGMLVRWELMPHARTVTAKVLELLHNDEDTYAELELIDRPNAQALRFRR